MERRTLYKYTGYNGTVVTPVILDTVHTEVTRLIADEGKLITDGENFFSVIDVESDLSDYSEILKPEVSEE